MRPVLSTGKFLYDEDGLELTTLIEIDDSEPETLREIEVAQFWAAEMNVVPEQRRKAS